MQKKNPEFIRVCVGRKLAEGVGFEPTVGNNPDSGLANRRTRPTMRPFRTVPKGGLEPPRAYAHNALNVACLPIPPLWQVQAASQKAFS